MAQNASDHSPLYFKVMELIRKDILDKLNPGEKIPTEFELIERYKASRITVRRALDELTLEGEIFRLHGKGTFKTRQTKVKNIVYVIYDISMLTSPTTSAPSQLGYIDVLDARQLFITTL